MVTICNGCVYLPENSPCQIRIQTFDPPKKNFDPLKIITPIIFSMLFWLLFALSAYTYQKIHLAKLDSSNRSVECAGSLYLDGAWKVRLIRIHLLWGLTKIYTYKLKRRQIIYVPYISVLDNFKPLYLKMSKFYREIYFKHNGLAKTWAFFCFSRMLGTDCGQNPKIIYHWFIYGTLISFQRDQWPSSAQNVKLF